MANKIIRIELKGTPSSETYDKLHDYMKTKGWSQRIVGDNGGTELPHAMYQGDSNNTCVTVAEALRDYIKTYIWTKPIVMVIEWSAWAVRQV